MHTRQQRQLGTPAFWVSYCEPTVQQCPASSSDAHLQHTAAATAVAGFCSRGGGRRCRVLAGAGWKGAMKVQQGQQCCCQSYLTNQLIAAT